MPNDTQLAKDKRKEQWNATINTFEETLKQLDQSNKNNAYQTRLAVLRSRVSRYSDGHDYQFITREIATLKDIVSRQKKLDAEREAKLNRKKSVKSAAPIHGGTPIMSSIPEYLKEDAKQTCCVSFFKNPRRPQQPIGGPAKLPTEHLSTKPAP